MTQWIEWLSGKKTKITAILAFVLGLAVSMGWINAGQQEEGGKVFEGFLMAIIGLLHWFQRLGTEKAEKKADEAKEAAQSLRSEFNHK